MRSTYCFDRPIRVSAVTDGLLRKTQRLARYAHNETCSQLLGRVLAKERKRLWAVLRKRGESPELIERADHQPATDPFPVLPPPDASPIDDVGPRE